MNVRDIILNSQVELSRFESPRSVAPPTPAKFARPARVVTLAALSRSLPIQLISHGLATFLASETRDSVLLVEIHAAQADVSLRDFAAILPSLNGEFCFAEHLRKVEGGFK